MARVTVNEGSLVTFFVCVNCRGCGMGRDKCRPFIGSMNTNRNTTQSMHVVINGGGGHVHGGGGRVRAAPWSTVVDRG